MILLLHWFDAQKCIRPALLFRFGYLTGAGSPAEFSMSEDVAK